MNSYKCRLLKKDTQLKNTSILTLEKPAEFVYLPGQYVHLVLENVEGDEKGGKRYMSLASSPSERDLIIAYRTSASPYKQSLDSLNVGSYVTIENLKGSFLLHDDENIPAVFLAGGIGITPFRSMIKSVIDAGSNRNITVFYSNKLPQGAVFLDELRQISDDHSNIKVVATMTGVKGELQGWSGQTGRINEELIRQNIQDLPSPIFYVVGSHEFVVSMRGLLKAMGIHSENIRHEVFCGYCDTEHNGTCCCTEVKNCFHNT